MKKFPLTIILLALLIFGVFFLFLSNSSSDLGACSGGTIVIGEQTWHKYNLNVVPSTGNSWCYNNQESNCNVYGRLYDWEAAMALPSSCNSSSCASQINTPYHQGICPSGYHIPTNADWDKLMRYVDGTSGTGSPYDSPTAGRYLKATSGWNNCGPVGSGKSYVCEDKYGFSALPGGFYYGSSFYGVGYNGSWWSASENDSYYAYYRYMSYDIEDAYWSYGNKSYGFSVRCIKN